MRARRASLPGAIGVGSFATLASLGLGLRGNPLGATIFLLLALLSLGSLVYFGRIYLRLRRRRWQRELERPNVALQQLFDRARAEQAESPPPGAGARGRGHGSCLTFGTRKFLLIAGIIGLAFACVGLSQAVLAQSVADFTGARLPLIIAWLILMPLFVYTISLRGRARKGARQRALERKAALDAEAARLRTPRECAPPATRAAPRPPIPSRYNTEVGSQPSQAMTAIRMIKAISAM